MRSTVRGTAYCQDFDAPRKPSRIDQDAILSHGRGEGKANPLARRGGFLLKANIDSGGLFTPADLPLDHRCDPWYSENRGERGVGEIGVRKKRKAWH